MERMNDILARAVQRGQQGQEHRTAHNTSPLPQNQGQRPQQSLTRRQIAEQTANVGGPRTSQPPVAQNPLPGTPRTSTRQGEILPSTQQHYLPRQRPTVHNTEGYTEPRRLPQYLAQEQRKNLGWKPVPPPVLPANQMDVYPLPPQADVADEWEEDTEGMQYGDWENNNKDEATAQPQMRSSSDRSMITREIPTIYDTDLRAPAPRGTGPREMRTGVPQLPMPQVPAQETRHTRITQPLDPQSLTAMSQNIVREIANRYPQSQPRQIQESTQQYSTIGLPTPVAMPQKPAVCPLCKGAGYLRADVPYGHPNFGKPIACECKEFERREKRRQQLREISNLGAFSHASFRDFNPNVHPSVRRAYQVAQDYAANPYGWLLLIGKNGCGKTHLAAAIANQSLEKGSLVLFSVVPELLAHLRATFAPTSNVVYDQLFANMREAELLILDDLGAQQSSPWANEKLFQLLNYRYNERFPTIITTNNLGLQGIEDRIRSRLTDASLVTTLTFEGAADYRPRNPRRD